MAYLFRKTVFDCRQATLLSIKREEGRITLVELLKLRYHLLFCDPCKRFIGQWQLLDKNTGTFNVPYRDEMSVARKAAIQAEVDDLMK